MDAALIDHLWQSTAFAVVAWGLALALRKYPARTRYLVWLTASLKFLVPFSLLAALGRQLSPSNPTGVELIPEPLASTARWIAEPLAASVIGQPADSALDQHVATILMTLWAFGCAVVLANWLICWMRARAAVRAAAPLRMSVGIDVRVSAEFQEPGVFGIRRPVLLLPQSVISQLSPAELEAVVAHELCHVRHRDNLTATMHVLVEAVLWFYPPVWWIGAQLLKERERACDEAVVELGANPHTYAEGILKVCRASLESRLGVVASATGANLKERIETIIRSQPSKRLGPMSKACLMVAAFGMLLLPISAGLAMSQRSGADVARIVSTPRAFESFSIQLSSAGSQHEAWLTLQDGRLSMGNTSLRRLIGFAYGVKESQVRGGPLWLDSRYDLEASLDSVSGEHAIDAEDRRAMILALLAEHFKLRFVEWGAKSSDEGARRHGDPQ